MTVTKKFARELFKLKERYRKRAYDLEELVHEKDEEIRRLKGWMYLDAEYTADIRRKALEEAAREFEMTAMCWNHGPDEDDYSRGRREAYESAAKICRERVDANTPGEENAS